MRKLAVFDNYPRARLYGEDARQSFNRMNMQLTYENGDTTILAIVQRQSDCNRYRGLSVDKIEYIGEFTDEIKAVIDTRIPPHGTLLAG